jgi:hypothetical protein
MTLLTLYLYICSGLTIGLLTAFSVHNRKSGWKKSRTTLAEALECFYSDFGLGEVEPEHARSRQYSVRQTASPVDAGDFTLQLINLKNALGDSTKVTPAAEEAETEEQVAVPVLKR